MRLQLKLMFLLLAIVAIFVATSLGLYYEQNRNVDLMLQNRERETGALFEKIIELKGNSLLTLACDYTYWDEMVNFVHAPDEQWLKENVETALGTFNAQAVWIYDTDARQVCFVADDDDHGWLREILNDELRGHLFRNGPFEHFFVKNRAGLVEIRGATIHPTDDVQRQTPAHGYFFTGRLWNESYLDGIAKVLGGQIDILGHAQGTTDNRGQGVMQLFHPLSDHTGKPLAVIRLTTVSPLVRQFVDAVIRNFATAIGLALAVLLALSAALVRWVSVPLGRISAALATSDGQKVAALLSDRAEFGNIARLVGRSLEQQAELRREIEQRIAAEEEKARLEDQLMQSEKIQAIGRLAGGIAHDFNNIMQGILGYSSMLLSTADPDSFQFKALSIIQEAAERAASLTQRLLGFARKGKYRIAEVDIHREIQKVTELIRQTLDRNVRITFDLRAASPVVKGDPSQMHQVLLNLAVNARDAMPSGGTLSFTTDLLTLDADYCTKHIDCAPGAYLLIQVADTGMGMTADVQKHLFEPFFTTKVGGTGMGLPMIHGIVKNHGGSIIVYSEPGHGTVFKIYLPVANENLAQQQELATPAPVSGSGTIMVIDDEKNVLENCADMLRSLGYRPVTFERGRDAIEYLRTTTDKIKLVLLDLIMPEMDGLETFTKLRELRPAIDVMVLSGFSADGRVTEMLKRGAKCFLQKPVQIAVFSSVVSRIVSGDTEITVDR